ncbi:MAG TPA: hypothetical protein VMU59_00465 [Caulobacteraceae bacterium]|nr:hypothetical protein [Caulobacteraceae bacterium]
MLTAGVLSGAPAGAQAPPKGPGSLTGLWVNGAYRASGRYPDRERILLDENGQWPPLLPQPKALLEQRITDSEAGRPFANTLSQCLPGGTPQMLFTAGNYPLQIVETPTQVIILMDEQNHFRIVNLNAKHANDPDPSYFGDSVGHWEGGDLVVDTIGLTDRTSLDQVGMPHSEDLHLVERFHRASQDRIEVEVTIDDPKTFVHPWKAKSILKARAPDPSAMQEYICDDNHNGADASGHQSFR